MFPTFFFHKMREVASFLQIVKGKVLGSPKERIKGVDNALNAMDDERQVYLKEKKEALQSKTSAKPKNKKNVKMNTSKMNKPSRNSGQDISAI